jgi:hypothetical protein
MQIFTGVTGSKLEARGGIVGGNIELQGLGTLGKRIAGQRESRLFSVW